MLNPPRERLLEAATILFHRQGYNNTGVNQIITESKVSKASFYDHFKSKRRIMHSFFWRRGMNIGHLSGSYLYQKRQL